VPNPPLFQVLRPSLTVSNLYLCLFPDKLITFVWYVVALLNPANYPALDKTPPIDSPEVLQWKQDVANSGFPIPAFDPTVAGMLNFITLTP